MGKYVMLLSAMVFSLLLCGSLISAEKDDSANLRDKANTLYAQGNYKDAYEIYYRLVLGEEKNPRFVADELQKAVDCLGRLNKVRETDGLIENAIEKNSG